MDDLISRRDTLNRLCEKCTEGHERAECGKWKCIDYQVIKDMPSADVPDMNVGEWIAYKGMQPPELHGKHYCSNCYHTIHLASNGNVYNYCPNCGSYNGGENEI